MLNRHGMWMLFFISGLITQVAANEPDKTRSVHLTPFPQTVGPLQIPQARTDSWPFELEPQESARYNVTIASSGTSPAPEAHIYNLVPSSIAVGVSPDYNYNILWAWQVSGGGQSYVCDVVNTVWVNNTALVSINCRWERTLTGGSGSGASGLGFDPIYGWALGLATHKQSDFEVSSSVEIDGAPEYLCVTEMIDLYAWLVIGEFPYDDSQLVDAVWSVEPVGSDGGGGIILEEYATTIATFNPTNPGRVRVTATVPNSSPTLTDSVEFTIVKVTIETEDEPGNLICVGGTKEYTAVVQPENVAGLGTFTWRVNNEDKLEFVDGENTGQTVTVTTGSDASSAQDAEELTVEFRINDELICEPSTNLTVFKVELVIHESGRLSNDVIKNEADDKNQQNYLIPFHKASDGNKIDLVLDPPNGAGNFFYEFRDSANLPLSPPRSGTVSVGVPIIVADLPISNGNESFDYTVRYGIDYDGDGTLSISEIINSGGGIPRIYGVSQGEWDSAHSVLMMALVTSVVLQGYGQEVGLRDTAYQMNAHFIYGFFDVFFHADFIPVANTPANVIVPGTSITHKFGYSPGGNAAANLRSFLFANGTAGSDHFESNPNLQNHVQSAYNAITFEEVNAAYVDDSTPLIFTPDLGVIEWGIDSGGIGDAAATGTLSVIVAKISTSEYTISAPAIDMVTRDLFDFNYFNTFTVLDVNLPPKAASVQCRHGVGGNTTGEVVQYVIELQHTYSFGQRTLTNP